jgi:hypothetical protein
VFKSIDGGKNWTVFNDGLGALNIRSLALAPGSPNVLYAATSAGVFKIIDGPIVTLNENAYCVGGPWTLTVSNTPLPCTCSEPAIIGHGKFEIGGRLPVMVPGVKAAFLPQGQRALTT